MIWGTIFKPSKYNLWISKYFFTFFSVSFCCCFFVFFKKESPLQGDIVIFIIVLENWGWSPGTLNQVIHCYQVGWNLLSSLKNNVTWLHELTAFMLKYSYFWITRTWTKVIICFTSQNNWGHLFSHRKADTQETTLRKSSNISTDGGEYSQRFHSCRNAHSPLPCWQENNFRVKRSLSAALGFFTEQSWYDVRFNVTTLFHTHYWLQTQTFLPALSCAWRHSGSSFLPAGLSLSPFVFLSSPLKYKQQAPFNTNQTLCVWIGAETCMRKDIGVLFLEF